MERLIDNKLIYGRLLEVKSPHLIERYNKALAAFDMEPTKLPTFDIDMTGFSPQIAAEKENTDYLDPGKINRRFILLSPEQENLPVVHTSFSNTAALMHSFFENNRPAIHAATIKDVLFGEIEDNIAVVEDIEDLLSINEVEFRVMSADDMLGKAENLGRLVDRLRNVPNAWRDDAMLKNMLNLARETGDIRKNVLVPDKLIFRHDAFWSAHFGGVYIFIDEKVITVIADQKAAGFRRSRPWQVSYIPIDDDARILEFLTKTGRIEIANSDWLKKEALLSHRASMGLFDVIHQHSPEYTLTNMSARDLRGWEKSNGVYIPGNHVFHTLKNAYSEIEDYGDLKLDGHPLLHQYSLIRSVSDHSDKWLVNRLIASKNKFDPVSRFIFDKQGFYQDYENYSDLFRDYVVEQVTRRYLPKKSQLRFALYGIKEEN